VSSFEASNAAARSRHNRETRAARALLLRAIEIDRGFAGAQARLAMSHHFDALYYGEAVEEHRSAAEKAAEIDPENADAHIVLGCLHAYEGEFEAGVAEFEQGLRLNPNHSEGWAMLADLRCSRDVRSKPSNAPETPFASTRIRLATTTRSSAGPGMPLVDITMPSKRFANHRREDLAQSAILPQLALLCANTIAASVAKFFRRCRKWPRLSSAGEEIRRGRPRRGGGGCYWPWPVPMSAGSIRCSYLVPGNIT